MTTVAVGTVIVAMGLPERTRPGFRIAANRTLRIGIVHFGARTEFDEVVVPGALILAAIATLMVPSFLVA